MKGYALPVTVTVCLIVILGFAVFGDPDRQNRDKRLLCDKILVHQESRRKEVMDAVWEVFSPALNLDQQAEYRWQKERIEAKDPELATDAYEWTEKVIALSKKGSSAPKNGQLVERIVEEWRRCGSYSPMIYDKRHQPVNLGQIHLDFLTWEKQLGRSLATYSENR